MPTLLTIVVLTALIIWHICSLEKVEGELTTWYGKLICFSIILFLTVGTYGIGGVYLLGQDLNIEIIKNFLGNPGKILYGWVCFIIGLFCLRHLLGFIFSRKGTIWHSD